MTGKCSCFPVLHLLGLLMDPVPQVEIASVQGLIRLGSSSEEEVAADWPMARCRLQNKIIHEKKNLLSHPLSSSVYITAEGYDIADLEHKCWTGESSV